MSATTRWSRAHLACPSTAEEELMEPRLILPKVVDEGFQTVLGLEKYVVANVERRLVNLIKLRTSLVNGCAYCVDLHTREATGAGESARRLLAVGAWRESPYFTERERSALAL